MVTRGFLFEKNQETGKIQLNHITEQMSSH